VPRHTGGVSEPLPTLTDGVVELRDWRPEDAAALAAIWTDPDIRARNTVPAEPTAEAALAWMEDARRRTAAGERWDWAVVDVATGTLAGRRALKDVDRRHRRATCTAWIAPAFRGRGFAPRSLRLAAPHAFAHGILRLHAEVELDNAAGLRAVRAAGMRHEGTLRSWYVTAEGEPLDLHVFGLVPGDLG
jgi:[ribosomal protein S5]-alanine N-acetyltransferase